SAPSRFPPGMKKTSLPRGRAHRMRPRTMCTHATVSMSVVTGPSLIAAAYRVARSEVGPEATRWVLPRGYPVRAAGPGRASHPPDAQLRPTRRARHPVERGVQVFRERGVVEHRHGQLVVGEFPGA